MDLFKPSKKVLEMICHERKSPLSSYEVFPFGTNKEMEELQCQYCSGTFAKIIEFYREEGLGLNEETKRRLDYQGIYNVVGESFKNWLDHSPKNSNLVTGLFLGNKGVCYGFQDEGDFFKEEEIKIQLEEKMYFEEFNQNPRGSTANSGFSGHIYPCSDFIEVDSNQGVMYCIQLKENIIAPEGEHGSQYCYDKRKSRGLPIG
jgi:hypothetical protein